MLMWVVMLFVLKVVDIMFNFGFCCVWLLVGVLFDVFYLIIMCSVFIVFEVSIL